jgi:hypothetical protein
MQYSEMLFFSIQVAILSFVSIYIIHQLFVYFRDMLTIPKTIDFIHRPRDKYKEIYGVLERNTNINANAKGPSNNANNKRISAAGEVDSTSVSMKSELKNYLKGLDDSDPQTNAPYSSYIDDNLLYGASLQ